MRSAEPSDVGAVIDDDHRVERPREADQRIGEVKKLRARTGLLTQLQHPGTPSQESSGGGHRVEAAHAADLDADDWIEKGAAEVQWLDCFSQSGAVTFFFDQEALHEPGAE